MADSPQSALGVLELDDPLFEPPPVLPQADERRMNVRAYNYWTSILRGRTFPSVLDLEPGRIEEFRDKSLLLDFSRDPERPMLRYIGRDLREECGISLAEARPEDVPGRSLISRLTDHYLEILANRAPIGFEAEFLSAAGQLTLYRGILLPLSDDGETINFIYGVINWKLAADDATHAALADDLALALPAPAIAAPAPAAVDDDDTVLELTRIEATVSETVLELTGTDIEPLDLTETLEPAPVADVAPSPVEADDFLPEDIAPADAESAVELTGERDGDDIATDDPPLDLGEAGDMLDDHRAVAPDTTTDPRGLLQSLLATARAEAAQVIGADNRSRAALYAALSQAYDFHLAASASAEAYATLLAETGLKAQARAPFTPIVKLVFGPDYDKTRLTEFAAALSHAARENLPAHGFRAYIERVEGGLKGMVRAEREARMAARGNTQADARESAMAAARVMPAVARLALADTPPGEFVLLLARRAPDNGGVDILAPVEATDSQIEAAVRRTVTRMRPAD
ncbi:hypothetical protein [Parapedomonas caeni]